MEVQLDVKVQTPRTPIKKDGDSKIKSETSLQSLTASRCTRSQVAPDWTVQEILVLVNEFASVNKDCLKSLPSYQKWKIISDNMAAFQVIRPSNQCQRKWESLVAQYKKIKGWESQSGIGSFWCLDSETKKDYGLPAFFDRELFGTMDGFLKSRVTRVARVAQSDSDVDSDSERHTRKVKAGMVVLTGNPGSKKEARNRLRNSNAGKDQELARKLQESAQLMHAILKGELTGSAGGSCNPADMKNPDEVKTEFPDEVKTKFARQQADHLIKVFGTLVGTLNEFIELVKEGG
ncbi:uncharacterized protein LOC131217621 [Magnolia sinica]|uniref:uncharacterized protein LOC131217621 n=1 Tax=Magnolia sinica TaxID=86752 RepID=UPI00265A6F94|nr:uncharacterized protein LOC131217621 [Magnolia sinica]